MLLLLMQLITKDTVKHRQPLQLQSAKSMTAYSLNESHEAFSKRTMIHSLPIGCLVTTGNVGPGVDRNSCVVVVVGAEKYSAR